VPVKVLALSAESKSLAFAELKTRIYDGSLELPDDPDLLAELRGLRTQYRAGRSTVVTPRTSRGHSDLAVALSLAVFESRHVGTGELNAEFVPESVWDHKEGSLEAMLHNTETLFGARPLRRGMRL
jgi:hypothetical protein